MDNLLTKFEMLTLTMNSPFIKLTLALGNLPTSTVLVVLSLYRLSKCYDKCPRMALMTGDPCKNRSFYGAVGED